MIVVLGWDALDAELIERYDVDGFGEYTAEIDTYVNEHVGEPHTKELWPSMITGLEPSKHGIRAATADESVDWDHRIIDTASTLAAGVVPRRVRSAIGRRLRERGAATDSKTPADYDECGLDVVFTDDSRPISIPNYETDYDRAHGLDANRNDIWPQLAVDRDRDHYAPAVATEDVYEIVTRELGQRVGLTLAAVQAGHDIVWPWFGALDTVGHMAPAMDASIQRDLYRLAGRMTALIRESASDEATVIAVSDHGLQAGCHTHTATIASDDPEPVGEITELTDLAYWLWAQDPEPAATDTGINDDVMDRVQGDLDALGYV